MVHFLVYPGNPAMVNIGCFLFSAHNRNMLQGKLRWLPCPSPLRNLINHATISRKAEFRHDWATFVTSQNGNIQTMPSEQYQYPGFHPVFYQNGIFRNLLYKKYSLVVAVIFLLFVIFLIIELT